MEDYLSLQLERQEANRAKRAAIALQEAKLKALQDTLGNYGDYKYVDLEDFIDPDNQNWQDYTYRVSSPLVGIKEHINAGTPVGMLIQQIRDAKNTDDVKKQLEVWNSYKPLDSSDNGTSYIRYFIPGFGAYRNTPSIGNRPIQTIAGGTGGAQGVVTGGSTQGTQTGGTGGIPSTQGVQGAQAGAKPGNAVAGGGVQGSNNGSGSAQGAKTGSTGGTYASAGVPRGGTKTIGYDPNPGNISLAYAMRNAPEQERRTALINKWNQEHGISYVTGKDGLIYRTDPQHPNGYVDPFKNDLSKTGSTGYATGQGMLTSGSNGTYATGEGIKDANGNVLTNPGGDWEYQYALKNPQYGLGMMGKMSDAQRNYLQAVSDDMGYNYNFRGATRFV